MTRGAGRLRRVATSSGRTYLVLDEPGTGRFLEVGAVLGSAEIEELEGPAARAAGLALAVRYLARRERTERQVREALRAEGIDNPGSMDYIVETLKNRNLLNDRRYASELIDYRMKRDPAGPALLRRKLAEAGVPETVTEELIAAAFPPGMEERVAAGLAAERLARTGTADRERAARRLSGFLARRGFASGIIGGICAGVLRGEITGETDEQ